MTAGDMGAAKVKIHELHKIPSDIPNRSVAEKIYDDLWYRIDVSYMIHNYKVCIFVDFLILYLLKTGNDKELRKHNRYNLTSFYDLLDGRTDFVDKLENVKYSMSGLIAGAVKNNDISLLKYFIDNKIRSLEHVIDSLTSNALAGDVRVTLDYLLSIGFFCIDSAFIVLDIFVKNDNLIMVKWMNRHGFVTKDGCWVQDTFECALIWGSINVAKWLASHGHLSTNIDTIKFIALGARKPETVSFIKQLCGE